MKRIILLFVLVISFSTITFGQYLQIKIGKNGNQVVVTARPKPGGGNVTVTSGWSTFELFFYYPNSISPTFGTLTATSNFPSYIASTAQWLSGPTFGSYSTKWLLCSQTTLNSDIVFTDGVEYELFRFSLTGIQSYNDITFVMDYSGFTAYNSWFQLPVQR